MTTSLEKNHNSNLIYMMRLAIFENDGFDTY